MANLHNGNWVVNFIAIKNTQQHKGPLLRYTFNSKGNCKKKISFKKEEKSSVHIYIKMYLFTCLTKLTVWSFLCMLQWHVLKVYASFEPNIYPSPLVKGNKISLQSLVFFNKFCMKTCYTGTKLPAVTFEVW